MGNRLFGDNNSDSNNQELSGEDALNMLVGEEGKYSSVEELAKAMVHSQNHIAKLEQENADQRSAQDKQTSLQEILDAIKTGNSNNHSQDDNLNQNDHSVQGSSESEDITTTVERLLNEREQQKSAASNMASVKAALQEALGDRAGEVYSRVGKSLGVDLDKLSETSPQAAIALVTGQQVTSNMQSSLPTGTVRNNTPERMTDALTRSQIDELYKKGGLSREEKFKLQNANAAKLGAAFFD